MGASVSSHIKQCSGRSSSGRCKGNSTNRDESNVEDDNSDGQGSNGSEDGSSSSCDPPPFAVAQRRTVKESWAVVEDHITEVIFCIR